MNLEQKDKIFQSLSKYLIPAIIDVQINDIYPEEFSFKFEDYHYLVIREGKIYSKKEENHQERMSNLLRGVAAGLGVHGGGYLNPITLESIKQWRFGSKHLNNELLILVRLASAMVRFLQDVEAYQDNIKSILKYSSNISLPRSRTVIIEKHKTI